MRAWMIAGALTLAAASALPSNTPTPAELHGCTPEAAGGDPALNALKDRITQVRDPASASIQQVFDFSAPSILTDLPRAKSPEPDRGLAAAHDQSGVVVTGYLVAATFRPNETWNCRNARWRDIRLILADSPQPASTDTLFAVVTPAWQDANAAWDQPTLRKLAAARSKIRITGWMLYANDDAVDLTRGRRTLWEIHPVTRIEIATTDGGWQEIVDTSDSREEARRGGWLGRREGANRSVARCLCAARMRIRARPRSTPEVVSRMGYRPFPTVSSRQRPSCRTRQARGRGAG